MPLTLPPALGAALQSLTLSAGFVGLAGGATRTTASWPPRATRRLAAITAAALLALWCFSAAGLPPSRGAYAVPIGVTALVLTRWPALRAPALAGALACLILGWAELHLWFWLWPGFRDDWVASTWSGHLVLGAPLGDLVWSVVFGATHPTVLLPALRPPR